MDDDEKLVDINISLPFNNERVADIVYQVLRVDKEPKRSGVTKTISTNENILSVKFSGTSAKQVKIASDNYFKNLQLILDTIEFTGPPLSKEYDHYYNDKCSISNT